MLISESSTGRHPNTNCYGIICKTNLPSNAPFTSTTDNPTKLNSATRPSTNSLTRKHLLPLANTTQNSTPLPSVAFPPACTSNPIAGVYDTSLSAKNLKIKADRIAKTGSYVQADSPMNSMPRPDTSRDTDTARKRVHFSDNFDTRTRPDGSSLSYNSSDAERDSNPRHVKEAAAPYVYLTPNGYHSQELQPEMGSYV